MKYKTRGNSSPAGKSRLFLTGNPEDEKNCIEDLIEDIFQTQNCVIYYDSREEDSTQREELLSQMQLFVLPVTRKSLSMNEQRLQEELNIAEKYFVPILPILMDMEAIQDFNHRYGAIHALQRTLIHQKPSADYRKSLEKYLNSVLASDDMLENIRSSFRTRLFLSYRRADRTLVQKLMRTIHQNDRLYDVALWYDDFLVPGEYFGDTIEDSIRSSAMMLLAVTPEFLNVPNYVSEVEYPLAKKYNIPILPTELRPTDHQKLRRFYRDLPEPVKSVSEYRESAALFQELRQFETKDNGTSPEHDFRIGLAYLKGVDVEVDREKAYALIRKAAKAGHIPALKQLVHMYRNGDGVERSYELAVEWQEQVLVLRRSLYQEKRDQERLEDLLLDLFQQGKYLIELQMLSKAEIYYAEMLSLSRDYLAIDSRNSDIQERLAAALNKMGDIKVAAGDPEKADEYFSAAQMICENLLKLLQTEREKRRLALAYSKRGDVRYMQKRYAEAESYYLKSQKLVTELLEGKQGIRERRDLLVICKKLGRLFFVTESMQEALKYYEICQSTAADLAEEVKEGWTQREEMVIRNRIAEIDLSLGQTEDAKRLLQTNILVAQKIRKETETAEAIADLAYVYREYADCLRAERNIEEAKKYYKKAKEILEPLLQVSERADVRAEYAAAEEGRLS